MELVIPYEAYLKRYPLKGEALYRALRDSIMSGALAYGAKLPPSRELCQAFGISRGTVNLTYDTLAMEGYVQGEVGRGTFVIYRQKKSGSERHTELPPVRLSAWGHRLQAKPAEPFSGISSEPASKEPAPRYRFGTGTSDLSLFPFEEWNRHMFHEVREMLNPANEDMEPEGYRPLRDAIAAHLRRVRGLDVEGSEVAIVGGSAQALTLLMQLLVDPGDTVVLEDPGYRGFRRAAAAAGGRSLLAPIDRCGIVPDNWDASVLAVTPTAQFPTGAVLSLERRLQLLSWAEERNALIIEDEYDSEFRYGGKPFEPLKTLDRTGRVAYVGTFSKTMAGSIRIGYVVLPPWLREPFASALALYAPTPANVPQQRALASFMASGGYERHVRRMKRVYARRGERLMQLLKAELADAFDCWDRDAGLHVFAEWRGTKESFERFRVACMRHGVEVPSAERHFAGVSVPSALFGFANFSENDLDEAIARMAAAYEEPRK